MRDRVSVRWHNCPKCMHLLLICRRRKPNKYPNEYTCTKCRLVVRSFFLRDGFRILLCVETGFVVKPCWFKSSSFAEFSGVRSGSWGRHPPHPNSARSGLSTTRLCIETIGVTTACRCSTSGAGEERRYLCNFCGQRSGAGGRHPNVKQQQRDTRILSRNSSKQYIVLPTAVVFLIKEKAIKT